MHNDGSKPEDGNGNSARRLGSKFLYWMGGVLSGFFGMYAFFVVFNL